MFQSLADRLQATIKRLRGQARLTEDNIQDTLKDIRIALYEADVALPVVQDFIEQIREKAIGQDVMKSLTPGQALIKIVNDELIHILGDAQAPLNLQTQPPAIILLAGLQGSGKTTTAAKLAHYIKERLQKKVMLVSTDVYRPAAIEQLKTLAKQIDTNFYPSQTNQQPKQIAEAAIQQAKKEWFDVVIIDTAGRLHIDDAMMQEIRTLHQTCQPAETLFVIDCMVGQDAVNTAKAFSESLPLTGSILTKTDGDARGGAALSVRMITGQPIKFIGTGEKIDAFEPFHPERIASRILGMGDILTLIEEAEQKINKEKAEKLAKKIQKQRGFDLEDFRDQLLEINKMGSLMGIVSKIPGLSQLPAAMKNQMDDKALGKIVAIINSMTMKERRRPEIINMSRKQRIAKGSGTSPQEVNKLLKQFNHMQKLMKKMTKGGGGLMNMLKRFQNTPFMQ